MSRCYLVVISRNKWTDYGLITDFPATLGANGLELKKRIKSFFPLDYADKDIKSLAKTVEPGVHLQLWYGRIESFSIDGMPYVEQLGRPINLGVGILQEISSSGEYSSYNLIDIKSALTTLILEYQCEQSYKPRQVELQALGVNGNIALHTDVEQGDTRLKKSANAQIDQSLNQQFASCEPALMPCYEPNQVSSPTGSSSWLDDLICLSRLSLEILDLLGKHTRCCDSKKISHFLSCASRRVGSLSMLGPEMNWRTGFKSLVDIWDIPIEKKLFIHLKLENPFWQHPRQGIRDAAKMDILRQQLRILNETLETESSLDSIDFRFAQISDAFHAALLSLLD